MVIDANKSGILIETISNAKPIIVTKGTWMIENMPKGIGETFENKNSTDLAQKIILTAEKYNDCKSNILQKAISWNEYHSAKNFLMALLKLEK